MKKRLIDTDILSYYFKEKPVVVRKVNEYIEDYGFLTISSITCFEILTGLRKIQATKREAEFLEFCMEHEVLGFDMEESLQAGKTYDELQRKGVSLPSADVFIASIALVNGCILVTNNVRHFFRIKGLEIENWLENSIS